MNRRRLKRELLVWVDCLFEVFSILWPLVAATLIVGLALYWIGVIR